MYFSFWGKDILSPLETVLNIFQMVHDVRPMRSKNGLSLDPPRRRPDVKKVRCCTKQVRSKDHLLKRNHKYEDHDVVAFSLPPCPCCALLTDEEIRASITISITITSYLTCQSDSTIAPSMRSGCLMDYVRW